MINRSVVCFSVDIILFVPLKDVVNDEPVNYSICHALRRYRAEGAQWLVFPILLGTAFSHLTMRRARELRTLVPVPGMSKISSNLGSCRIKARSGSFRAHLRLKYTSSAACFK